MAVIYQTNNRVLPANQRASDVASLAVERLAPIQAQKIQAAFRVQGIEACLYNHLTSGKICSCQGHGKKLNSRLNKEGKASTGFINELIVGSQFGINTDNFGLVKDESEAYNQHPQPNFPTPGTELMPTNDITLDDLVGDFDAFSLGVTDAACPICYGTGFVGGFSLYNGYRHIITADEFSLPAVAELHYDETPLRVTTYSARVKTIIPKNIVGIDVFRCLNGTKLANYKVYLDGKEVSYNVIIKAADGKEHEITLLGSQSDSFTHFEIQFNMSTESTYFEVPKLSKGTDLNKLDDMQDFQILMSPLIPRVDRMDVVTESMWGKALMIQTTSLLNTKERQMLGWECDARVIQPEELYNLLPRRQRVATIGKHINPVLGNYGRRL